MNPDQQQVAVVEDAVTHGVSPKAVLAFFYPLIAALGAAVVSWIATGMFNAQEIKIALGGLVLSLISGLGAVSGRTGTVIATPDKIAVKSADQVASDALLASQLPGD